MIPIYLNCVCVFQITILKCCEFYYRIYLHNQNIKMNLYFANSYFVKYPIYIVVQLYTI